MEYCDRLWTYELLLCHCLPRAACVVLSYAQMLHFRASCPFCQLYHTCQLCHTRTLYTYSLWNRCHIA